MKHSKQRVGTTKSPFTYLLVFAAVTTLYFNSKLQDPFNAPKQWILLLSASWSIGYLRLNKDASNRSPRTSFLRKLLSAFLVFLLCSTLFTDVTYTALFGETQRRLGFLTYCGFAIFMLVSAFYIRLSQLNTLYYTNFIMGTILGGYGLLQYFGKDFVPWSNPYNRIIGTLGNPNFASSMMAIVACICAGALLINTFNALFRISNMFLALLLLFEISASKSIQGLVAFSIGISAILMVLLIRRSRALGLAGGFTIFAVGIFAVLGMLQIGPLTNLLYKDSVSVRGFYWQAGIEMFRSNPWLGVGVDRFGANFKQFRDQQYVLNYGFDISSSSAHNTFIQMFATAGVFVGFLFLFLHLYILICGVRLLTKADRDNQLYFTGIFAAWLVYVSQMVISIDNIGLTIWGWILGGSIVGLLANSEQKETLGPNRHQIGKNKISIFQPLTSGSLTLITLALVATLYRGESISIQARDAYNYNNPIDSPKLFEVANQTFTTPLIDPYYKLKIAELLAISGKRIEAKEVIKQLSAEDPRNQDFLMSLAALSENLGEYESAINLRKSLSKFDPWNAKNYLELGRNYKIMGDFEEMAQYREIVIEIDSQSAESEIAKVELVN